METLKKETILNYLRSIKPSLQKNGIVSIALFGSFAKENPSVYSDIDIAIRKEEGFLNRFGPYDYFDMINAFKTDLSKKFHRPVDIFDLDSASPLKKKIEKELIYV
jgi:predicted nucleotidyltransferase